MSNDGGRGAEGERHAIGQQLRSGVRGFWETVEDEVEVKFACSGRLMRPLANGELARSTLGELQDLSQRRYVTPYGVGRIYAALGEKDQALQCLEAAYQGRDAWMIFMKIDPRFDGLRSDPLFRGLMRKMNFPA